MAVIRSAGNDACLIEIHKRVEFLRFFLADDVEFETDIPGTAFQVLKPFFFHPGEALADAAALMKNGLVAGFLRQDFIVELNRVVMNLRNGMIADEVRTKPGGVPALQMTAMSILPRW